MTETSEIIRMLLQIEGVHEVTLVQRDGAIIEQLGDAGLDGAQLSISMGVFQVIGHSLQGGSLFDVWATFEACNVYVTPIGNNAVLGITTTKNTNRFQIQHAVFEKVLTLKRALTSRDET